MADDPNKRGPADRSRISLLEPHEVQYWADKFGVSINHHLRRVAGVKLEAVGVFALALREPSRGESIGPPKVIPVIDVLAQN